MPEAFKDENLPASIKKALNSKYLGRPQKYPWDKLLDKDTPNLVFSKEEVPNDKVLQNMRVAGSLWAKSRGFKLRSRKLEDGRVVFTLAKSIEEQGIKDNSSESINTTGE